MFYFVIKAINNNVVLASDSNKKEKVILMSKGIGFNKAVGDKVSDQVEGNQLFKLWSDENYIKNITYDHVALENAIKEIVKIAKNKLNITQIDFEKTLFDHLSFSIDRLNFNLPFDNLFRNETFALYAEEYEIAKLAVDMIKLRLNIDLGEAEIGLISLHLNSARRNRPISTSMEHIQLYNKISSMVCKKIGKDMSDDFDIRTFLMSLARIIKFSEEGNTFKMPSKEKLFLQMIESYQLGVEIVKLIKDEIGISLNMDSLAFMTVDIEKIRQIYKK